MIQIFISLGRNPVRLTPGVNLKIPFYHQVSRLDLRESSISIPNVRSPVTFDYINIFKKKTNNQNDSFRATLLIMLASFKALRSVYLINHVLLPRFLSYVLDPFSTVFLMGTR